MSCVSQEYKSLTMYHDHGALVRMALLARHSHYVIDKTQFEVSKKSSAVIHFTSVDRILQSIILLQKAIGRSIVSNSSLQ